MIDAGLAVDGAEKAGRPLGALGRAEQQISAGVQGVIERGHDLFLQLAIERYDVRLSLYRTVEGKIDGLVITFLDVTDHHDVQESLRKAALQQRVIERSRDPICIWELDRGIVAWSSGSEELYGYSGAEALGRRKETLLRTTAPESSFSDVKAALLKNGAWTGLLLHIDKKGRTLSVDSQLELQEINGQRLVLETVHGASVRTTQALKQN